MPTVEMIEEPRSGFPSTIAQKIPFELLSNIFLLSLQSYPQGSNSLTSNRPPWTLTSVCHCWRQVALATPLLWTSLPRLNTNTAPYKLRHFLRLSLERSALAPFKLDLTAYLPANANHNVLPLLDDLAPHMDRCSDLILTVNSYVITHLDIFTQLCALESLQIKFYGPATDFPRVQDHHIFPGLDFHSSKSPHLRSFTIDAPLSLQLGDPIEMGRAPVVFDWIKIPWDQLTSFMSTGMPGAYILEVLRHAPQLQEVYITDARFNGHIPVKAFTQSNIRAFTVMPGTGARDMMTGTDKYPAAELLAYLDMPRLRCLEIPICRKSDRYTPKILQYLQNSVTSGSSLTTLALHAVDCGEHLSSVLDAAPNLHTLEICNITSNQLSLLRLDREDDRISGRLPYLQCLVLVVPSTDADAIQYFLQSRMFLFDGNKNIHQPLERLILLYDTYSLTTLRQGDFSWEIYYLLEGWEGMPKKDSTFQQVLKYKRRMEELFNNQRAGKMALTQIVDKLSNLLDKVENEPIPARYLLRSAIMDIISGIITSFNPINFGGLELVEHPQSKTANQKCIQMVSRLQDLYERWTYTLTQYFEAPRWVMKPTDINPTYLLYETGYRQTKSKDAYSTDTAYMRKIKENTNQLPWYFRSSRLGLHFR